jgi:hypothetical protein
MSLALHSILRSEFRSRGAPSCKVGHAPAPLGARPLRLLFVKTRKARLPPLQTREALSEGLNQIQEPGTSRIATKMLTVGTPTHVGSVRRTQTLGRAVAAASVFCASPRVPG